MSRMRVLLLTALETKAEEAGYLSRRLSGYGIASRTVDLSLGAGGTVLGGPEKLRAMEAAAARAREAAVEALDGDMRAGRRDAGRRDAGQPGGAHHLALLTKKDSYRASAAA